MKTTDPSGRLMVEDLSDCRSESSHSETQLRAYQDYERIKELNVSLEKDKDEPSADSKDYQTGLESNRTPIHFDEYSTDVGKDLSMTLNKSKDYSYTSNNLNCVNYSVDRAKDTEDSFETAAVLCRTKNPLAKDILFNLREPRQNTRVALSPLDRCGKDFNLSVERDIKDFGLLKNYGLDRMKEFNLTLDQMRDSHMNGLSLQRLRGSNAGFLEGSAILEHSEFRNLQMQPRSTDLDVIALEHMRRSHLLGNDLSPQNLSTQLPHAHSITQMQQSQQQQQQQAKSFTIDAILGLRNNQREKRAQQQQYRKHQGQEGSTRNSNGSSCSGNASSGGGKTKRVRTIFTAEQLERLEGEFARQQYMVGPERLYLAHALRLTEAQVKVWFQNRRIKWRKHNHEQQSQRVHEFQRTLSTTLEHEDSCSETDKCESAAMMEQPERPKTKYAKPYASSWTSNGYQTHSRETPEATWKYVQRNPLTVSSNRANRQHKHHTCTSVTHPKYTAALIQNAEIPHRHSHNNPRAIKDRSLGGNVALTRSGRYKDEIDDESPKYIDEEIGNLTEDNGDEDAGEEVEDEEEETGDDPEKDYEEPEADDEVDDDTEISPQLQRMQRRVKNEALLRAQRMRDAERQQDLRRLRYQSHPSKLYEDRSSSKRYYHNVPESDTAEAASEEDQLEAPAALRNTSRRSSLTGRHRTLHTWPQTRNTGRSEMTRYDAAVQPTRRVRAWQDAEHMPEPRIEISATKKCSRCGGSDRKTTGSRKAICRLQNHREFPTKGPVGDEIKSNEDTVCGRCNLRHGSEKTSGSCEIPRPGLYNLEPRRTRDTRAVRSAAYETPEEVRAGHEVPEDYPSAKTRHGRENPGLYRQTTKHSLQPPRDRTRTPSEYNRV